MNVLSSNLYEKQLKEILEPMAAENYENMKKFKLYLDTIVINLPTKAMKYKPSKYFDNEQIRDIEHEGFTLPFFIDNTTNTYIILGICKHL